MTLDTLPLATLWPMSQGLLMGFALAGIAGAVRALLDLRR